MEGWLVQRAALTPHSMKVTSLSPGPFCEVCMFSPCCREIPLGALISPTIQQSKDVQHGLIGEAKLSEDVNVWWNGHLSGVFPKPVAEDFGIGPNKYKTL